MFGAHAPVWSFLARFGGAANPLAPAVGPQVFETYPVLTMIALGWSLPDARPSGRLPKYNPERTKAFSIAEWQYVCLRARDALSDCGLVELSRWIDRSANLESPRKRDQDRLDACLCLLTAIFLADDRDGMMVGDQRSGYIVAPDSAMLRKELEDRCRETRRISSESVRVFRLTFPGRVTMTAVCGSRPSRHSVPRRTGLRSRLIAESSSRTSRCASARRCVAGAG